MSEWITDRRPCAMDTDSTAFVYNQHGAVTHYTHIKDGEAWMTIPRPEPYVKPKIWTAAWNIKYGIWTLRNTKYNEVELGIVWLKYLRHEEEHREAAERIAAIYEELMP